MKVNISIILRPTEDEKKFLSALSNFLPKETKAELKKTKGFCGVLRVITVEEQGKRAEEVIKRMFGAIPNKKIIKLDKDSFVRGKIEERSGKRTFKIEIKR